MKDIPLIKGKELDVYARKLGLIRKKRWWFFKESDRSLRERMACRVCQITNKQLSVLGVTLN